MALAVADAPSASSTPRKAEHSLGWYGIAGTLYVVLAWLVIAHLIPWAYWQVIPEPSLITGFGMLVVVVAAAVAAVYIWNILFPPVYGLRAAVAVGVGNLIMGFIVVFILGYVVDGLFGKWLENIGIRFLLGMAFLAVLAAWWINRFILKAFHAPGFPKRMQKLEDGGWFSAEPYKKVQGLKIRRITMLTVILTVGLGVYAYGWARGSISVASAPYTWDIPFVSSQALILFRTPGLVIPVLLLALAVWFGYRLVNHPPMAEFLINTEAELAKVTWTSRKRLIRDTGVVLLTVLFFVAFLYLLDIIWVLVLGALGVLHR